MPSRPASGPSCPARTTSCHACSRSGEGDGARRRAPSDRSGGQPASITAWTCLFAASSRASMSAFLSVRTACTTGSSAAYSSWVWTVGLGDDLLIEDLGREGRHLGRRDVDEVLDPGPRLVVRRLVEDRQGRHTDGLVVRLERLGVGDCALLGQQLVHVVEVDPVDRRVALGFAGVDVDRGEGSAAEDAGSRVCSRAGWWSRRSRQG